MNLFRRGRFGWSLWQLKTTDILVVTAGFVAAILLPGWYFWNKTHGHPAQCLYGRADCSTAVATYLLCALTLLAFIAAFEAVRYAGRSLRVSTKAAKDASAAAEAAVGSAQRERTARVAVSPCPDDECPERAEGKCKVFYIDSTETDPLERLPPGRSKDDFLGPVSLDCVSVGPSAAINATVDLQMHKDDKTGSGKINLGTIRVDQIRHVDIYINEVLMGGEFTWLPGTVRHDGHEIEFYPHEISIVLPFDKTAEEPPGASVTKPVRPS